MRSPVATSSDMRPTSAWISRSAGATCANVPKRPKSPAMSNGQRHHGAYDIATLTEAVSAAKARQLVSTRSQPRR